PSRVSPEDRRNQAERTREVPVLVLLIGVLTGRDDATGICRRRVVDILPVRLSAGPGGGRAVSRRSRRRSVVLHPFKRCGHYFFPCPPCVPGRIIACEVASSTSLWVWN